MISVIIPTYNREKTIERAITSVLKQTYGDLELIVVDDCSTDDTKKVVESIGDDRVRYIRLEKNSGACVARNRGICEARGEYVAFQDSDDEWLPEKLEIQLKALTENNADFVFCSMIRKNYADKEEIYPDLGDSRFLSHEECLTRSLASTQTFFCKTSVAKDVKFDEKFFCMQDYDFCIRVSERYSVYYVNVPLVNVYLQNDSITKKTNYEKRLKINLLLLDKYGYKRESYPLWETKRLKVIANCQLHLKDKNAGKTLKEIYKKEKTPVNFFKIVLYKLGLLKFAVKD